MEIKLKKKIILQPSQQVSSGNLESIPLILQQSGLLIALISVLIWGQFKFWPNEEVKHLQETCFFYIAPDMGINGCNSMACVMQEIRQDDLSGAIWL